MRETRGLATCSMRLNAVNASKSMTNKRERAISAPPVKRKREKNDYMRRSPSTSKRMRVQNMSECLCGLCSCGATVKQGHLCDYCEGAHPDYHKHDCNECEE